jgi:hypothetical protein
MNDDLRARQKVVDFIKTNEPKYSEANFEALSYTELVILKTEIELQQAYKYTRSVISQKS